MGDIPYTQYDDAEEGLRHLRKFRDKTIEICRQANTVYRTESIECVGTGAKELSGLKRLSDASDLAFYSVAPVYVGVGGDVDILGEYSQMCAPEFQAVVYVSNPVFKGLAAGGSDAWNHRIEAIDTGHLEEVTKFLSTEAMYRDNHIIRIAYSDLRFPDPVARSEGAATVDTCKLRVFYPFSMKGTVCVTPVENGLIECTLRATPAQERAQLRKLELAYEAVKEMKNGNT